MYDSAKSEKWKPIAGFEGKYLISNFGRIKSINRFKKSKNNSISFCPGGIIHPAKAKNGYWNAVLCKNGKRHNLLVHRLVAIAFIPNPHHYPQVNHIDGNKNHNYVSNLEWCTAQYNIREAYRMKLNSKAKEVIQYTLNGKIIHIYSSANAAQKKRFL